MAAKIATAKEGGTYEPVSLHPYIDPAKCIGSGACVKACHETDVIGLSGGKGRLINAALCVGHGACAEACPMGAITLVFGTATRAWRYLRATRGSRRMCRAYIWPENWAGWGSSVTPSSRGPRAVDNIAASLEKEGPTRTPRR